MDACSLSRVGFSKRPDILRCKQRCAPHLVRTSIPAAACLSCPGAAYAANPASKRLSHAEHLAIGSRQAELRGCSKKRRHAAVKAVAVDAEVSAAPVVIPPAFYKFRRQDGGWLNVRVDTLADGSCAVHVHATQLPSDRPCFLHWGMYRSSPGKWLHPKGAIPPGSEARADLGGAMHTPLVPDGRGRHSLTFAVPANLLPLYLGCSVFIGGPEPRFCPLKRGLHGTIPMGMGAGNASLLGAHIIRTPGVQSPRGDGKFTVNFAVVSRNASAINLRVMRVDDNRNVLRSMDVALDPITNRSGDVWHISIPNLSDAARVAYAWVATGPEGWDAATRFAPGKLLLDPYAEAAIEVKLEDAYGGGRAWVGSLATQQLDFSWHGGARLKTAVEKTFMMEVDVPSFTDSGTAPQHRGKFQGVLDKLEELQNLGVTAVVLSCPMLRGPGFGVGGQAHMSYFAPDPRFAVGKDPAAASRELKQLVHGLHAAGIEVLLEVEFCFTTEGGDTNAAVSGMRGIDAGLYYRPGGLLKLAHPVVRRLVVDSLCYWTSQYQVDGFMLLSAEALVQDREGNVLDCPPLVQDITNHPVLCGSKIVTYPISSNLLPRDGRRGFPHAGRLLQHSNSFSKDVLEWLDTANPALISRVALRLTGSADMFDADDTSGVPGNLSVGRRPAMAVNSTLSPIVDARSLQSWCQEVMDRVAPTLEAHCDWTILMRTVILVTILAQGTPMLSTADVADTYMQRIVCNAMLVRRRLHEAMQPARFDSPRDVAWYSIFGASPPWDEPAGEDDAFLAVQVSTAETPGVYFGINPTRRPLTIMLPPSPQGTVWHVLVDTSSPCDDFVDVRPKAKVDAGNYVLNPKAAFVLEAVPVATQPRSPIARAF